MINEFLPSCSIHYSFYILRYDSGVVWSRQTRRITYLDIVNAYYLGFDNQT